MNQLYKDNRQLIISSSICISVIVFSFLLFKYLFAFVAPFAIGWLLSLLYEPFVRFANHKLHFPRWVSALLSVLLVIAFFSSVVSSAIAKLVVETKLFIEDLPLYIDAFTTGLTALRSKIDSVIQILPDNMQPFLDFEQIDFVGLLSPLIKSGSSSSFTAVKAIPNFLLIVVISLLSSYFFSRDRQSIHTFFRQNVPQKIADGFHLVKINLIDSLYGYFKTQLILMMYTFIVCIIGFLVLRSPYAFLLAFVTSFIDALPIFGSGFILWPFALASLLTGSLLQAVGYIIIYLAVQLLRQIMQPKILGTQIGLTPLISLISMFIGLKLLGFVGMIFGPVIAVIIKALICAVPKVESAIEKEGAAVKPEKPYD